MYVIAYLDVCTFFDFWPRHCETLNDYFALSNVAEEERAAIEAFAVSDDSKRH